MQIDQWCDINMIVCRSVYMPFMFAKLCGSFIHGSSFILFELGSLPRTVECTRYLYCIFPVENQSFYEKE